MSRENIEELLERFVTASQVSAKSRTDQIPPLVTNISDYAYQHGLSNDELDTLVKTVTKKNYLDQASQTTLVKNLYPAGPVKAETLLLIVGSIGHGGSKTSPVVQALLLRWIVLVWEVLEDKRVLSRFYSVLFNLLDTIAIRQLLCHILAMLTTRKHIKPFRIQVLLDLIRSFPNDNALLGLLRIYKDFCPELVLGMHTFGKKTTFRSPDTDWGNHLAELQSRDTIMSSLGPQPPDFAFRTARRHHSHTKLVIPEVHTFRTSEATTSLEDIDGVEDFVAKIDKIEMPSQTIAVLQDRLFSTYTVLWRKRDHHRRLNQWLSSFLVSRENLDRNDAEEVQTLGSVLKAVLHYIHHAMEIPEVLRTFLPKHLQGWNGIDNRDVILDIMVYLPLQSFHDLHKECLGFMENALLSSTSSNLANLLDFYTDLLRKWTSELLANTSSNHEAFPSVAQLTDHTNVLILTLVTTNPSVSTTQSIMAHLRAITDLSSRAPKHLGIRIISPPSLVVYLLTFVEPTITTMSPLSGMLAAYKKAFEASLTLPETERYPQEYVNNFNGYLMDVCNLLWRGRAFNTSDTNARGCLLPAEVYSALESYTDRLQPPQSLPSLFSLSLHPSLAALSNAALRELEQEDISNAREDSEMDVEKKRHAGPVSQRSLILLARSGGLNIGWAEYRQAVLRHLADRGLEGVRDLMYCTMTVLIGSKGRGSTLPAPGQDNSQAIGVQ